MALAKVEAKQAQRRDVVDAHDAVRDVHGVVQVLHQQADDLAKAQGHDGQVVASQAQRRRAQRDPRQGRQSGPPASPPGTRDKNAAASQVEAIQAKLFAR